MPFPELLTSATDIGEPDIDEVYGWGLYNIEEGIRVIENMRAESMGGEFPDIPFAELRGSLPPAFAHLQDRLQDAEIAVKITGNLYASVPLSKLAGGAAEAQPAIGRGAKEMFGVCRRRRRL